MTACEQMIDAHVTLRKLNKHRLPKGFKFLGIDGLLKEHGREFKPGPLPPDIRRGRMKMCYKNAGRIALSRPDLIYCEGYARGILPVPHAWLATPDGIAIDPTWEDGVEYFGVPIKTEYLRKTILKAQRWGVLDQWEIRWPILRTSARVWKRRM